MARITRRALGASTFAGLAAQAYAKSPAVTSPWPDDVAAALDARIAEHEALPFPVVTSGSLALR